MEKQIKDALTNSRTIAMVGVSYLSQEKENLSNVKRKPSIIVMKYLQEFGYKVIPVNPNSEGKEIYGEKIIGKLEDINIPVDIVNIFRPSRETPELANQSAAIGANVLWLQFGIHNEDAHKIAQSKNINYVSNRCIKQEYQRLFLKVSPVFPALKS